jgi:3-hydroxyisobutyrate dehydrogenase
MTTLAFLGTGTMGLPMARNLAQAGFQLRAWNRSAERAQPLSEHGADVFEDPREAATGADLLITMLSDADPVIETAERALGGAEANALWLQMSTIGVTGTERCTELAGRSGVTLVDAPVLGTREPAEQAKLIILASGPNAAQERCQPVFDALGPKTLWLGEAGAGTRAKVAANSWVVGVVGVLAETINLFEALEVDPKRFFEAIDGGPLDLPYARLKGSAMLKHAFDDPSFKLALARKDAELILEAASLCKLELPILEAVADRLSRAEAQGHGDEDMAATYWVSAPEFVRTGSG